MEPLTTDSGETLGDCSTCGMVGVPLTYAAGSRDGECLPCAEAANAAEEAEDAADMRGCGVDGEEVR